VTLFARATRRTYRLRMSNLWCMLLVLAGVAAVLLGKRR
jgi:hypothetical protein